MRFWSDRFYTICNKCFLGTTCIKVYMDFLKLQSHYSLLSVSSELTFDFTLTHVVFFSLHNYHIYCSRLLSSTGISSHSMEECLISPLHSISLLFIVVNIYLQTVFSCFCLSFSGSIYFLRSFFKAFIIHSD